MTVHHIADYMTPGERHDAFMRLHPIVSDDLPCDVEPTENNLRPDGTMIVVTGVLETLGKEPA